MVTTCVLLYIFVVAYIWFVSACIWSIYNQVLQNKGNGCILYLRLSFDCALPKLTPRFLVLDIEDLKFCAGSMSKCFIALTQWLFVGFEQQSTEWIRGNIGGTCFNQIVAMAWVTLVAERNRHISPKRRGHKFLTYVILFYADSNGMSKLSPHCHPVVSLKCLGSLESLFGSDGEQWLKHSPSRRGLNSWNTKVRSRRTCFNLGG